MISSPALVSGPTTSRKRNPATPSANKAEKATAGNKRFAKLRELEISFIDNPAFREAKSEQNATTAELVREVERGAVTATAVNTSMPAHLARLCSTPLLSAEEEREAFRRMNFHKSRASGLCESLRRSNKQANEIEDHLAKAERLRNYLVQANTRLVMSIARGFADNRNSFDDLLSQGIASLLHAVEKFDFDRGYRFSTYATCAVRRDLYRKVMGAKKDRQRYSTGAEELLTGCTDYRAEAAGMSETNWRSLSESLGQMLEQLDEREQMIMAARFGFGDEPGKASYSKLGDRLGISKERVRQLANRAISKLRELATEHRLESMLA